MCVRKKPAYSSKPIGSLDALSRALNVDARLLRCISDRISSLYYKFTVQKKDGTDRYVVSPNRDLKFLQKRINRQIFSKVVYPDYLYGGIAERDYVKNALAHKNAKALIALDVKNFYPSISKGKVKLLFQRFFNFPVDVAESLAKICTLNGEVPQGACTSSHIANLIFYDSEPTLAEHLMSRGYVYTRLLDDICISNPRGDFSKDTISDIIKRVRAMLLKEGMKLKEEKTRITRRSNPENLMEVTGLWLNRGLPRIKSNECRDIRKEFRELRAIFNISREGEGYYKKFNRVSGRVAKLAHLKHNKARKYREELKSMLPHLSASEALRLRYQVKGLLKTKIEHRCRLEYIEKYGKIKFRVYILKRSNPEVAQDLLATLARCVPTRTRDDIIYGEAQ